MRGDEARDECCEMRSVAGLETSWVSPWRGGRPISDGWGGAWRAFFRKGDGGMLDQSGRAARPEKLRPFKTCDSGLWFEFLRRTLGWAAFFVFTVNGWLGRSLCSLPPPNPWASLCCPLLITMRLAPFFFFLLSKVCKQESRGLKPATQLYLASVGRGGV